MKMVWIVVGGLVAVTVALRWWRNSDDRALDDVWRSLVSAVDTQPQ